MFSLIYFVLLLSITYTHCILIPFIRNVTFVPRYKWNSTTVTNHTYEQCLCMSIPSFLAFNWFPNNTCQLFYTFPVTYRIQSTPQARLYFPQRIFPNASQCCMPDLAYLLNKLKTGTWSYISEPSYLRNLLIDNNGYLVTVVSYLPKLDRFNAQTLTVIDRTSVTVPNSYPISVTLEKNAYFIALRPGYIIVIDSTNLTILNTITSSYIHEIRDIMFLDNGRTMVITNNDIGTIVFFHQTGYASSQYTFAYQRSVSYVGVHGLTAYNDSYFFATSYETNSVYSYTAVENSTTWIETLFIDATNIKNTNGGTFMTIDECGRYWFSLDTSAVYIFDHLGSLIGNFSFGSGVILDTLITDNYVMYFSDTGNSLIIRIDPHIEC